MKNPEVEQWFKNQAEYTNQVFSKVNGIQALAKEWNELSLIQQGKIH
jgi:hypothetical protein